MSDVSGSGGSTPSAHPHLPAAAGLDEIEDRTAAWWEERGLSYVLEVELAKKAIEVWRQWRDGAEPSAAQHCAAVIHYAVNDACLAVDADEPAKGRPEAARCGPVPSSLDAGS